MFAKVFMTSSSRAARLPAAGLASFVVASMAPAAAPLRAGDYTWAVATGGWSVASNWGRAEGQKKGRGERGPSPRRPIHSPRPISWAAGAREDRCPARKQRASCHELNVRRMFAQALDRQRAGLLTAAGQSPYGTSTASPPARVARAWNTLKSME